MCHLYPYNNVKLLRKFFYINFSNGDLFQPRTERRIGDRAILCRRNSCMESPTDRTESHAIVDSNVQAPSEVFSFFAPRTDYVMHPGLIVGGVLQILLLLLLHLGKVQLLMKK